MNITTFHKGMYLNENELMENSGICPFCKSDKIEWAFTLQRSPDIHLMKCRRCYAVSASRMPIGNVLSDYYNIYYNDNDKGVTIGSPQKFAYHIKNRINFLSSRKTLNVLDFGSGSGAISLLLSEYFIKMGVEKIELTLVDYNTEYVNSEIPELYIDSYENIEQIPAKKFDIIIASAVVEHIPNPVPVITALLNSLNEGGVFYARTPYALPLIKLLDTFKLKIDFTYPGHLHDLGCDFWNNILKWINVKGHYDILYSNPSIVETSFKENFIRTCIATLMKLPWYLLKNNYNLVGGWEIFIKRKA